MTGNNMVTFDNYFMHTCATFKGCKTPRRKPDYISYSSYNGCMSSRYWYGRDKKAGEYVIRDSDHWVKIKDFTNKKIKWQCASIASCRWSLKSTETEVGKFTAGKCYLKDFIPINQ